MPEKTFTEKKLLNLRKGKGNICVSIIIPTHRTFPDRKSDVLILRRAINKAEQLLQNNYPADIAVSLMNTLDTLLEQVDFNHNEDGLGLYVSSDNHFLAKFPFPVKEKVVVGNSFQIRDVLYKANYSDPYYVLLLAENEARLFNGSWNELEEINDNSFPMEYEDEYHYDPPGRSISSSGQFHIKNLEKDKSKLEVARYKDFFQNVDKSLSRYLLNNEPLIILGAEKQLAMFENVSTQKNSLAEKINGSYTHFNIKQLSDLVSPVIFGYLQNERAKLFEEFKVKVGQQLATSGIEDIWNIAREGKAFKLIVEKDYHCPGFLDVNTNRFSLRPPAGTHITLTDAVDDLMELVFEKGGMVFFVDNGLLKDYHRMVLITRY